MKVLYLGFDQPVDFGAGGSSNYYSAQKHPGCTVTEEGPWMVIRHRPSKTKTRVPVTNIPYLREPWDGDDETVEVVTMRPIEETIALLPQAMEDVLGKELAPTMQYTKGGRKLP